MLSPKLLEFGSSGSAFVYERMKLPEHLYNIEKEILKEGLRRSLGSKAKTSQLLGIPLPTLKSKIKKFEI
jgi:transcriptional regulator with PAS, ATPase and Fis domain